MTRQDSISGTVSKQVEQDFAEASSADDGTASPVVVPPVPEVQAARARTPASSRARAGVRRRPGRNRGGRDGDLGPDVVGEGRRDARTGW